MVVNYDLPNESENYVHRIGRTARAGKTGKAVTLASEQDVYQLPGIERYIGGKIPSETVTAELLEEDKSEGKRIHTEFGEGERHSGRRDRDAQKGKYPRKGTEGRKKQKDRIEHPVRKNKKDVFKNEAAEIPQNVKLSELSLEERMAYYRQKYDKGSTKNRPHGAQPEPSRNARQKTKSEKQPGKNRRGENRNDESRHSENRDRSEGRKGHDRPKKKTHEKRSTQNTAQTRNTQTVVSKAPETAETKKGILSRIMGMFKKSK
jgi:ATP-dependent RNA helicase RhlB